MSEIIISIIIPIYNASRYVSRCIDHIVNQPVDSSDYEIICVDDCSIDNSRDIVMCYSSKYSNVKLISHKENKKQGAARNTGLMSAVGKYIWYIDADDYIVDNFLCHLAEKEICVDNVDIYQFNSISINIDGSTFNEEHLVDKITMSGLDYLLYESRINYKNRIKATWSKWYRREFLVKNNLLFKEGVYWEDVVHTLKCFYLAEKIVYKPLYGYMYVQTPNSDMRGKQNGRKYADSIRFCVDCLEFLKSMNAPKELTSFYFPYYEKTFVKCKKNLNRLSFKEFLIFSKSVASMNTFIISDYYPFEECNWLKYKYLHFLVWIKLLK